MSAVAEASSADSYIHSEHPYRSDSSSSDSTASSGTAHPSSLSHSNASIPQSNAIPHTSSSNTPAHSVPPSPRLEPTYRSTVSLNSSLANSPSKIKVRDLSHIQSFASEEVLTRSRNPSRHSLRGRLDGQQYEISAMPVADIIEMVAGLLTKITTTNDRQHEQIHRHMPSSDGSSGLNQQASSVLAFHGKNVPSITIASYLMRIHKYCPTTYEVFLSLLVYFDRMTEMVNTGALSTFPDERPGASRHTSSGSQDSEMTIRPEASDLAEGQVRVSHGFVVDSFNIHRLVMAGVTCASKFFSDVFYTNSRYAKVGGLPLVELNHLELQFLLLNDFRLSIPLEELEAYGTMLVEFYASEIVSQQQQAAQAYMRHEPTSPRGHEHRTSDGLYMQTAQ